MALQQTPMSAGMNNFVRALVTHTNGRIGVERAIDSTRKGEPGPAVIGAAEYGTALERGIPIQPEAADQVGVQAEGGLRQSDAIICRMREPLESPGP